MVEDDDETDMRKQSEQNFSLASSTQMDRNNAGDAANLVDSHRVDTSFTKAANQSEVWKIDDDNEN